MDAVVVLRKFSSIEQASRAFRAYARLEPRLLRLWELCRNAAPPLPANDDDDVYELDRSDDGWCAEQYFNEHVKPYIVRLVGWGRAEGPPELQSQAAYEAVYAALFYFALDPCCACCGAQPARNAG